MIFYNKIKVLNMDFYIARHKDKIVYIDTTNNIAKIFKNHKVIKTDDDFEDVKTELEEYFLKKRNTFSFNYELNGSEFSKSVWCELTKVPHAKTITYKQLSESLGDAKKVRAVANAVGKNPLLIIIPCHRVIGSDGKLHGFRAGLELKQRLLKIEDAKL